MPDLLQVIDGGLVADTGVLRVEFDASTGGIRRLVNLHSGHVIVDAPNPQPWRMTLQGTGSGILPPTLPSTYRATEILPDRVQASVTSSGESGRLRWTTTDEGVTVEVEVRASARGGLELWPRVEVAVGVAPPVDLTYPLLTTPQPLASSGADDRVVFPAQSGWLISDPLQRAPLIAPYPDGYHGCSLQLMAYYEVGRGGLAIAAHDPHSTFKRFCFSAGEVSVTHEAWDVRVGACMDLGYPIVLDPLVVGDWHEAAEGYRQWAHAQAPWCSDGPNSRPDRLRARWLLEDVGLSIWGTPSSLDWSRWYDFYADAAGTPLHICAGWDWPAKRPHAVGAEGWLPARFHEANTRSWAGHHVTPYMNDLFVSSSAHGFQDRWEPNLIFPYSIFSFTTFSEPSPGWVNGHSDPPDPLVTTDINFFVCPTTAAQSELHAWRDVGLSRDHGMAGACYDISSGNPASWSRCLRAEHGHPPGRGRQIITAYDDVNLASKAAVRGATGAYFAQGVETIIENVVGSVDFYVSRACAGPMGVLEAWTVGPERPPGDGLELIPLFQAVYHDIGPVHEDGWLTLSVDQGELFFWVAARITLQWGGILSLHYATNPPERPPGYQGGAALIGWDGALHTFDELPEPDPAKIAFVRQLAEARTGFGNKYLGYGRLVRTPRLETGSVTLGFRQQLLAGLVNEGEWSVPDVLHSAWLDQADNLGLFLVNLRAAESVSIALDVDVLATWGLSRANAPVTTRTGGGEHSTRDKITTDGRLQLNLQLEPRTITLIEVLAS